MKPQFNIYDSLSYLACGYLLCFFVYMVREAHWFTGMGLLSAEALGWTIVAYIVGHVNSGCASWLLEKGLVKKYLGLPVQNLLMTREQGKWAVCLFGEYFEPLPDETFRSSLQSYHDSGSEKAQGAGENHSDEEHKLLIIEASQAAKSDDATWDRMNIFLNLYGFSRNVSFALLVGAALFGAKHIIDLSNPTFFGPPFARYAFLALAGSIGMLYRYLKFYRLYYFELLSFFVVLQEAPAKSKRAASDKPRVTRR
jgi:hypothetical protein